jgi:DNA helicase-2/ATP-dependent DNA helicase PcrA
MTTETLAEKWLRDLNPSQKEAVTHGEGPVLVLAGAGSGKTRVLTYRIAYLIAGKRVRPWNILAVTFTNKAAREMKGRVEGLLGGDLGTTLVTFHSWCARFLRREAGRLGYPTDYSIYDDDDQIRAVKQVMQNLEMDTKRFNPNAVLSNISRAKNKLISPEQFENQPLDFFGQQVAKVYAGYEARLRSCGAMDFDDLLFNAVRILKRDEDVRGAIRGKIQHLLVDEYQDTNHAQYALLRLLAPESNNVMVVGDDDQSIYGWRGAEIKNILDFEKDFEGAHVVALEQNYRSTQPILDLASAVVKQNSGRKRKELWTERIGGDPVKLVVHDDDRGEALWTTSRIDQMVQGEGRTHSEFAVLYRTNAQSRTFEENLRAMRIPYTIVGGVRFYQRREIKDLVAYLRVLVNPADDISLQRIINVPRRGIGKTSQDRLIRLAISHQTTIRKALAKVEEDIKGAPGKRLSQFGALLDQFSSLAQELTPPELAHRVATETGMYEELVAEDAQDGKGRTDNVKEFIAGISEYCDENPEASLGAYLEEVALLTDVDNYDDSQDRVTLMTLHAAKGLEYPVVFLAGLEEGLFPLSRSMDSVEDVEEERRLFYVGITRAQQKLHVTWAHRRRRFGEMVNLRSRFLDEISEDLYEEEDFGYRTQHLYHRPNMVRQAKWPRKPAAQTPWTEERINIPVDAEPGELAVGARVRHAQFGEGRVTRLMGGGEHLQLEVIFQERFKKKLLAKYAKLEVLS